MGDHVGRAGFCRRGGQCDAVGSGDSAPTMCSAIPFPNPLHLHPLSVGTCLYRDGRGSNEGGHSSAATVVARICGDLFEWPRSILRPINLPICTDEGLTEM